MIKLTCNHIDRVIRSRKMTSGLKQYRWLQARISRGQYAQDPDFGSAFSKYYGLNVGRASVRQAVLKELRKVGSFGSLSYPRVLRNLKGSTGRLEASFASKVIASFDPEKPVIDKWVLLNTGVRLPLLVAPNRDSQTLRAYRNVDRRCRLFLATEAGRFLVRRFIARHQARDLTAMKMLDFVLWQTR